MRACLALVTTLVLAGCAFDAQRPVRPDPLALDPALVTPERAPPLSAQATILERNLIAHEQQLNDMFVQQLANERGRLLLMQIDAGTLRGRCLPGAASMICGGIPIPVAAYSASERQRAGLARL